MQLGDCLPFLASTTSYVVQKRFHCDRWRCDWVKRINNCSGERKFNFLFWSVLNAPNRLSTNYGVVHFSPVMWNFPRGLNFAKISASLCSRFPSSSLRVSQSLEHYSWLFSSLHILHASNSTSSFRIRIATSGVGTVFTLSSIYNISLTTRAASRAELLCSRWCGGARI